MASCPAPVCIWFRLPWSTFTRASFDKNAVLQPYMDCICTVLTFQFLYKEQKRLCDLVGDEFFSSLLFLSFRKSVVSFLLLFLYFHDKRTTFLSLSNSDLHSSDPPFDIHQNASSTLPSYLVSKKEVSFGRLLTRTVTLWNVHPTGCFLDRYDHNIFKSTFTLTFSYLNS